MRGMANNRLSQLYRMFYVQVSAFRIESVLPKPIIVMIDWSSHTFKVYMAFKQTTSAHSKVAYCNSYFCCEINDFIT